MYFISLPEALKKKPHRSTLENCQLQHNGPQREVETDSSGEEMFATHKRDSGFVS